MSTAVPSSGAVASTNPHSQGDARLRLRRAPVLLRLPALQGAPVAPPPEPHQRDVEEQNSEAAEKAESAEHAHATAPVAKIHEEAESAPREKRHAARRERKSRPAREAPKKPSLSQWLLGGCMLTAGVLGFFALSGDFGAAPQDVPPADGWRDRASADPIEVERPDDASPQAVTVRREPAGSQDGRNWSDPAEGEIVQTPPAQTSPGAPSYMGAAGLAEPQNSSHGSTPSLTDAADGQPAPTARPTSLETTELSPPQNAPAYPNANTSGAVNPYPTTGASGLSPLSMPAAQGPQAPYVGAANVGRPQPSSNPAYGFGAAAAGPAMATPMTYPSTPAYPTTMVSPSSAYPTTSASAAPFPNNLPSAMSPRYERIR